jgi:hypothetical protein
MKQILFAAALFLGLTSSAEVPNEKVLNAFEKTFSQATDVKWQDIDNNFEASFTQADVKLRVQYDAEGNIIRSIRYYKAHMLPILIQSKIQKKFSDKKIYSVTEITSTESIGYHIILEDAKTWTNVKSDMYGNLTIESKFTKG